MISLIPQHVNLISINFQSGYPYYFQVISSNLTIFITSFRQKTPKTSISIQTILLISLPIIMIIDASQQHDKHKTNYYSLTGTC